MKAESFELIKFVYILASSMPTTLAAATKILLNRRMEQGLIVT
jgi:hypothetical protein